MKKKILKKIRPNILSFLVHNEKFRKFWKKKYKNTNFSKKKKQKTPNPSKKIS